MTSPQSWPLTHAVIELAGRAAASPNPPLARAGGQTQLRLRQPLCVAVVGRVSAGKSTMVNALLGEAISPTAGGECTTVVYAFRHGRYETAVVVPRDGSDARVVKLDDNSRLPASMPLPATDVRSVDVTLASPQLERVTLLDTPGLASTHAETSAVTARLLADTADAAAEADALLFCLNGPLMDDEAQAVRGFRVGRGGSRLTGGTALGLLTKADQLSGDRHTTWKQAAELARQMSTRHAETFFGVVPVIGLLAETASTGSLREPHARDLAVLAREWTQDDTESALSHPRMFLELPAAVSGERRQELLDLLGLFGIGELLDALRTGTEPHAAALTNLAYIASGLDEVAKRLNTALDRRADVLKAAAALDELRGLAREAGDRSIEDAAQTMLDRPEMFPLRVMEMAQLLAQGQVRPPRGLIEQAWITVQSGLPPTTRTQAQREAAAWRQWAMLTDGKGQQLARVMVRAWQLAATQEDGHRD
jgi:hypothetical protein